MDVDFAWAIDLRLKDHPPECYLGVLGFEPKPEPWRDGFRICTWRTRREARTALAHQRAIGGEYSRAHYWNRARVVQVTITVAARRG